MWNRTFLRFTFIEWLVAVIFLLILARVFFAKELSGFEDSLFTSVHLGGGTKYLVTVPLAAWIYYRLFKREQAAARDKGIRIVRPRILVGAIAVLILAIGTAVLTTP